VPATGCNIARISGYTPASLGASGHRLATAVYIVVLVSNVFVPASTANELVPLLIILGIKNIVAIPTIDDVVALVWEHKIVTVTSVDDVIA
jgi:hypothetical protein